MSAVGKRARPLYAPAREKAGNVTALFGSLHEAAEQQRSYHRVLKERDALHALLERATGLMAVVEGRELRYSFANAAYSRLLGHSGLAGNTVAETLPPAMGSDILEILDQVYVTGEPRFANSLTLEVHAESGDQPRRRTVNFVFQPIRAAAGIPVTGILIEGHDVTELNDTHARIQARHMELIHVSRVSAMGTMASTVAHELNQPLAAITNYLAAASRLAGRDQSDARLEECIASAKEASLRAGNILRLLRDMTMSAVEITPTFDVEDAVRQAMDLASASHPEIVTTCELEPGIMARVDRIQFQQILLNLVRNAHEACGSGPCRLEIKAAAAGNFLKFSLADNGPGFLDEDPSGIFDALTTTKPCGMGVGLSVCRTIVETYGGKISAQNRPAGGAIISFTIPSGS